VEVLAEYVLSLASVPDDIRAIARRHAPAKRTAA
jgi:hypothetical protein